MGNFKVYATFNKTWSNGILWTMSMDKWAQLSTKIWVKLLLLLENALKLNFEVL